MVEGTRAASIPIVVDGTAAAASPSAVGTGGKPPLPPPPSGVVSEKEENGGEARALATAAALARHVLSHPEFAGVRGRLIAPLSNGDSVGPVALLPLSSSLEEEGQKEARGVAIAALTAGVRLAAAAGWRRGRRHPAWCQQLWEGVETRREKAVFTGGCVRVIEWLMEGGKGEGRCGVLPLP